MTDVVPALQLYLDQRAALGMRRYGVPLQTDNGRDPTADRFAEFVDFLLYWAQEILEDRGRLPPGDQAEGDKDARYVVAFMHCRTHGMDTCACPDEDLAPLYRREEPA